MNPARPGPLDILQTPEGALALAIAALLGVLGLRLLGAAFSPSPRAAGEGGRVPGRTTAAAVAWGAALPLLWAGGHRLLPGPAPEAPVWLRVVGAGLLLVGLLAASRRVPAGGGTGSARTGGVIRRGWARASPAVRVAAGLSVVLLGQLARAPSAGGAAAAAVATAALAWAAAGAPAGPGGLPERMNH